MSSSDVHSLVVESELDVEISLYDGTGAQLGHEHGALDASVPPGLYRVQLERAGRIESLLIEHVHGTHLRPSPPLLRTPAIIRGAITTLDDYVTPAIEFSTASTAPGLGERSRTGHLMVLVRRVSREVGRSVVPSEPLSVLDVNGRPLVRLDANNTRRSERAGYAVYAADVAPGIYRIRAEASHRDFAVAIPPHRAARVFLADTGRVCIDDLRLFLAEAGQSFDPDHPVGLAMEAAIEALRAPAAGLPPPVARWLGTPFGRGGDLCLGILAGHLLLRSEDRDGVDADAHHHLLDMLVEQLAHHAERCPDIAVLHRVWARRRHRQAGGFALSEPPMLRASFLAAMSATEHTEAERYMQGTAAESYAAMTVTEPAGIRVPPVSALAESARGGHHDSLWWTWSHRAWDTRWIEPTVNALLGRTEVRSVASIARTLALPVGTIAQTIAQTLAGTDAAGSWAVDAKSPRHDLVIPDYQLGELLGRGSQGVVYQANRVSDGKAVALKVIAFSGSRTQRRNALREISKMEALDHPHLLALTASGPLPDDDGVWLEIELCRGSVLDRLVELDAPMSIDEGCRIICEALEGIAYLHDRGIVHRDIKPANLLLRSDGSVAVADFGLARAPALRRGMPPRAGGTARFAAPEQLEDFEQASPASDVWAMAATLYFLLTLELPRDEYADQSDMVVSL